MKKETIDFSGVPQEIGARAKHIPPGDYAVKIVSVEKKWKNNDKSNPAYFSWKFQVAEGPEKGAPLYFITSLKPEALFNLRNLIFAAKGKNVAGKAVAFDPESLVGSRVLCTVEDDEYEGKIRSRAVDVQGIKEEADEEEEETEVETEDEDLDDVDVEDI